MQHSSLVYIYCFSKKTAFLLNFTFLYFSKLNNFWWSNLVTKYHKPSDKVEIEIVFYLHRKFTWKEKKIEEPLVHSLKPFHSTYWRGVALPCSLNMSKQI